MWRKAEKKYNKILKERAARAARTESSAGSGLEELVDQYTARGRRPAEFTGDLSGSAPVTVVDGDVRTDDPEHREDIEYIELMKSKLPLATNVRMATLEELKCCTPLALIDAARHAVAQPLAPINARLCALELSETPHRSVAHFSEQIVLDKGAVFVSQDGPRLLFAVYGTYGVTCLLDVERLVLLAHVFTETP